MILFLFNFDDCLLKAIKCMFYSISLTGSIIYSALLFVNRFFCCYTVLMQGNMSNDNTLKASVNSSRSDFKNDLNSANSMKDTQEELRTNSSQKTNKKTSQGNGKTLSIISKDSVKLFVIAFLLISIVATVAALYFTPSNAFDTRSNAEENITPSDNYVTGSSAVPEVINAPITKAYVGKEYFYTLRIADADSSLSDISIKLLEAPSWLEADGLTLIGVPEVASDSALKVSFILTDGKNEVDESFYLFIYPTDDVDKTAVINKEDDIQYDLHSNE